RGETRRQSGERAGARIDVLAEAGAREVELAGGAVVAAVQLSAEDDSATQAGADRQEREVLHAATDAEPLLAERGEVDVVVERDREREPVGEVGREVGMLDAGDVR